MSRRLIEGNRFAVYSDCERQPTDSPIIEVHPLINKKSQRVLVTKGSIDLHSAAENMPGVPLDFPKWLPFASKSLKISASLSDYIVVPVVIMPTDLPNRNGVAFPLAQLVKWDNEMGRVAYKTWTGQPVHYEHANQDPTKAYGVVVDTYLRKLEGYGEGKIWKVVCLLAIDRNKYPEIAQAILKREMNAYSMGAMVQAYTCGHCNANFGECFHLNTKAAFDFRIDGGKLVYRNIVGPRGIEVSIVHTPAYTSASNDNVRELR